MEPLQLLLLMLGGVTTTLAISIFSFLVGLAIGLPLSFVRAYGKDLGIFVDIFEKIFRGIPEIVLMWLFYFGVGFYLPSPFKNSFFTAVFALGLRSAANQSQIFRGAIRGIGDEQLVAAQSLGVSKLQAIEYVMIPQVFIFSAPGLGSEYALVIKDSSYAFMLPGNLDMMAQTNSIAKATGDLVPTYLMAAFLYILLTFPVASWLDSWGGRRKRKLGL